MGHGNFLSAITVGLRKQRIFWEFAAHVIYNWELRDEHMHIGECAGCNGVGKVFLTRTQHTYMYTAFAWLSGQSVPFPNEAGWHAVLLKCVREQD